MFALVLILFRMITADVVSIKHPSNIAILSMSLALIPSFVFWMARQERLQRPALVPNSIWKNKAFTCVCLMILLVYAVMQTMELFASLLYPSPPSEQKTIPDNRQLPASPAPLGTSDLDSNSPQSGCGWHTRTLNGILCPSDTSSLLGPDIICFIHSRSRSDGFDQSELAVLV